MTGLKTCLPAAFAAAMLCASAPAEVTEGEHPLAAAEAHALELVRGEIDIGQRQRKMSPHGYYVRASRPDTVAGLLAVLRNPEHRKLWEDALGALGIVASVDKQGLQFAELASLVEEFEARNGEVDPKDFLPLLGQAYAAVGRFGTPDALRFLLARLEPNFWGERMPEVALPISHGSAVIRLNGLTEVIRGFASHPSPDAEKALRAAQTRAPFAEDEVLMRTITDHLELRSLERELHVERLAALVENRNHSLK